MSKVWKHFSLFLYLSLVVHLYVLYFLTVGLDASLQKWMTVKNKPGPTVIENIVVSTLTETEKPKSGVLSDKANRRSGKKSLHPHYNYLNPKPAAVQAPVRDLLKDISGNLTVQKKQTTENGSPASTLFDFKKNSVIEMDNAGVGSLDTLPSDVAAYLLKVNRRISEKWHGFFPVFQYYQGIMKDGEVVVYFEIQPDGKLASSKIVQSFGYSIMDDSCLNAVRYSAPFEAFPKNFSVQKSLQVRFKFIYLSR